MDQVSTNFAHRPRVASLSSNETVIEFYSSAPPTSFDYGPDDHAPPLQELEDRVGWARSGFHRDKDDTRQLGLDSEAGYSSRTMSADPEVPGKQQQQEIEQETESEECIDWDEDSDHAPKVLIRRAPVPQTVGFWFDLWLGDVAASGVGVCFFDPFRLSVEADFGWLDRAATSVCEYADTPRRERD
jgi:hypothetical protein